MTDLAERSLDFPMHAARFKRAVAQSLEPARGTYIHRACLRDLEEKTAREDPCRYRAWLAGLVAYLRAEYSLEGARILDLGCGNGEFTVMLNLMGLDATGIDVNDRAIALARILAEENGIDGARLVQGVDGALPFAADSFDVVLMISSLEHVEDAALDWMVPELARVCRGVVFVQVPSPMKVSDDHTGLRWVPWMPARLARAYVALRGTNHRYAISQSGRWDVVYRSLPAIERRFAGRFDMSIVPPEHSFPPCGPEDAVLALKRRMRVAGRAVSIHVPLVHRQLQVALGRRRADFYPYYNLAFRRRCA